MSDEKEKLREIYNDLGKIRGVLMDLSRESNKLHNEIKEAYFKIGDILGSLGGIANAPSDDEEEEVNYADVGKIRGLVNPADTYAVVMVKYNLNEPFRIRGLGKMEFSRYNGEVKVVLDEDLEERRLILDDGTEIDFMWLDDAARILSVIYGEKKKDIMKVMLKWVYSSGKDKPVGFLYKDYFVVIAPRVEVD